MYTTYAGSIQRCKPHVRGVFKVVDCICKEVFKDVNYICGEYSKM